MRSRDVRVLGGGLTVLYWDEMVAVKRSYQVDTSSSVLTRRSYNAVGKIKDAHKETFKWIFDKSGDKLRPWSNCVRWLEKGSRTYWINGKAGSGKST